MTVLSCARRNLAMHWRDKTGVFFSLLAPLIILMLFLLFLGKTQVDSLVKEMPGLSRDTAQWAVQALLVGSICFVTTMTMPLGGIGVLIEDRIHGRLDDILVTPASRRVLAGGYALSAFLTGLVGTLGIWLLGALVMVAQGLALPGLAAIAKTGAALVGSCAVFSALAVWLATGMRTQNAYAAVSTIFGTMVGFVAGVYVPMGVLPDSVANTVTALPFAQAATLIREPLTAESFAAMTAGAPAATADAASQDLGLTASVAGNPLSPWLLWLSLAVYGLIFGAFAVRGLARVVRRG